MKSSGHEIDQLKDKIAAKSAHINKKQQGKHQGGSKSGNKYGKLKVATDEDRDH